MYVYNYSYLHSLCIFYHLSSPYVLLSMELQLKQWVPVRGERFGKKTGCVGKKTRRTHGEAETPQYVTKAPIG